MEMGVYDEMVFNIHFYRFVACLAVGLCADQC